MSHADKFYFIPCYNISTNEIYFTEYFTETVVKLNEKQRDKIRNNNEIDYLTGEKERNNDWISRCTLLKNQWEEIKVLSNLEQFSNSTSQNYINYFKKPFNSKFWQYENWDLYSFYSISQLPSTYSAYGNIKIKVCIGEELWRDWKLTDIIKTEIPQVVEKKVNFIAVIDSIIIDVWYDYRQSILEHQKVKDVMEFKRAFHNWLHDEEYKLVLKLNSYEEFFYGDYTIGSFESVRKNVREYEVTFFHWYKKSINSIKPNISHHPPIVPINANLDFNYFDWYDKYTHMYSAKCILFRMFEAKDELKNRYIAKKKKRKVLLDYGESGDCDVALNINIIGVNNLKELEKWWDNEKYNENEMVLPYFNNLKNQADDWKIEDEIKTKAEKKRQKEEEDERKKKENWYNNMWNRFIADEDWEKSWNYLHVNNYKTASELLKKNDNDNNATNQKSDKYTRRGALHDKEGTWISSSQFFNLKNNILPFNPRNIKVVVTLLYGSYEIQSKETEIYNINNIITISELFVFDSERCWISSLPKETRWGINWIGVQGTNTITLGSGQIPLFDEDGFLRSGDAIIKIWPNFRVTPRINSCADFNWNYTKYIDYYTNEKNNEETVITNIIKGRNVVEEDSIVQISRRTAKVVTSKWKQQMIEQGLLKYAKETENDTKILKRNQQLTFISTRALLGKSEVDSIDCYCEVIVKFPSFAKKIIHTVKSPQAYFDYLDMKNYVYKEQNNYSNDTDVTSGSLSNSFDNWYYSAIKDESVIINSLDQSIKRDLDVDVNAQNSDVVFNKWEDSLNIILNILKKTPFSTFTPKEREAVILCRDYISTIPGALEIFLRCIDWFNPLQVNLAHLYLTKWTKIEAEDAVSLLDSRFPDTKVREYAINILRNLSDDVINLYMLQMCQCWLYETHIMNPLSDFLIERSLRNPKWIGNSFFWNAKVGMSNPWFMERLSVILCTLLMVGGPSFIEEMFHKYVVKVKFQQMSKRAKIAYATSRDNPKQAAKDSVVNSLTELSNEKLTPFSLPIDPSYYCNGFDIDKTKVFDSKMVPIKIACISSDNSILNVMFKIGDDLRQDVWTWQIMKIMDKMWMNNDLDLKIFPYKVWPTDLKAGFIEFVNGEVWDGLQQREGVGGAWDRELLIKFLRSGIVNLTTGEAYESDKQYDNYVRSLAGYCVATCVIGVGDRHPGNVMIKTNGVFFHIDFGHILGNFKKKFNINRERSPFLLTPEMSHIYIKTNKEEQFKTYCTKAFNIWRHNASRLANLLIVMSSAGMPEVFMKKGIDYLLSQLKLDWSNDEDATKYFLKLIDKSKNEKYRLLDNIIHNMKHG